MMRALGRVQLQEQRVNTLLRRRDEVRSHSLDVERDYGDTQRQLEEEASALRDAEGPLAERLRDQQRMLKRQTTEQAAELQRWTADMAAVEAAHALPSMQQDAAKRLGALLHGRIAASVINP